MDNVVLFLQSWLANDRFQNIEQKKILSMPQTPFFHFHIRYQKLPFPQIRKDTRELFQTLLVHEKNDKNSFVHSKYLLFDIVFFHPSVSYIFLSFPPIWSENNDKFSFYCIIFKHLRHFLNGSTIGCFMKFCEFSTNNYWSLFYSF